MATMEALRFDKAKKKLAIEKIEVPKNPGPHEVIIKVAYAGVCGTDIHIVAGRFPCKATPVTMGHEFSGVVTEVGSEVTHIKKGDRVTVDPNRGCYCCTSCTSGLYQLCPVESIKTSIGIWSDGGFAPYAKVPAKQVFCIPDKLSLDMAALTEPVSCVSHGVERLGVVPIGKQILIIGAGIIGVLWANTLHLLGHRKIMVSEPSEGRRKLIAGLGLGLEAVTPQEVQQKHEKDPSWGVDVVIDCSGNARAIESSIDYLLPGGTLMLFGVAAPEAKFAISPFTIYKNELTVKGILINPYSFPKSLGYLESFSGEYLEFKKNGIQVFPLDKFEDAFNALKSGVISKAMFKLN